MVSNLVKNQKLKWKVLLFLKKQSRTHETQINVTTQHNSNSWSASHPSFPMCPDLAYGESPPGTLAPAQPGPAETQPRTPRGPSSSPVCLSPDSGWLRLSWESIQIYARKSGFAICTLKLSVKGNTVQIPPWSTEELKEWHLASCPKFRVTRTKAWYQDQCSLHASLPWWLCKKQNTHLKIPKTSVIPNGSICSF